MNWHGGLPGLLDTGAVGDGIQAVRDGFMNLFVVSTDMGPVCIDAGWRSAVVARELARLSWSPGQVRAVFLTHRHWDHVRGVPLFVGAEVFVGGADLDSLSRRRPAASRPCQPLDDGQVVTIGRVTVQAIAIPGHTAGSVAYLVAGRLLFTGDAIRLRRGVVRPFPAVMNLDPRGARDSLRKLAAWPGVEAILTAHTGLTRNPIAAFAPWRCPVDAAQPGG